MELIANDKCFGILESVDEMFPETQYQQFIVRFYSKVF